MVLRALFSLGYSTVGSKSIELMLLSGFSGSEQYDVSEVLGNAAHLI
jgi:hypothetical protein